MQKEGAKGKWRARAKSSVYRQLTPGWLFVVYKSAWAGGHLLSVLARGKVRGHIICWWACISKKLCMWERIYVYSYPVCAHTALLACLVLTHSLLQIAHNSLTEWWCWCGVSTFCKTTNVYMAYMYVFLDNSTHAHACTLAHMHVNTCSYARERLLIHTCSYTCECLLIHTWMLAHMHMNTHMHACEHAAL
jgi:hypothetical protein